MNDRDEQFEARLRSYPLPGLSNEAKRRILSDLASGAADDAKSPAVTSATGVDQVLWYETPTLPQTIWRTIMTHKIASVCIATATCAAIVVAIFLPSWSSNGADRNMSPQGSRHTEVAGVPSATGGNAVIQPVRNRSRQTVASAAAARPFEKRVAEAEVIVVATCLDSVPAEPKRPNDVSETLARFRVSRVLKGKLDTDMVTIQTPNSPVGADVNELAGKDWILMLSPAFIAGKDRYAGLSTIKSEPEVLSILAEEQKDQ
jgi:hypothetical protein